MYTPTATYRFQLQKDFNLKKLKKVLDYLHQLGISTIYASPIMVAVTGSRHGYDDINPLELNPEIGTMNEWESIREELKQKNMGWLQDIVPNHMAYSADNKWIFDVLERGKLSIYYEFFDIIPQSLHPIKEEKIMLPFLGRPLETCIREKEIQLCYGKDGFFLQYFTQSYPVATNTYHWICGILPGFYRPLLAWSQKLDSYSALPFAEWTYFKKKIMAEVWNNEFFKDCINRCTSYINNRPELLSQLLSFQHFMMKHWKASRDRIDYRRFFAVNSLICLRMEDENVFHGWHPFLLSLCEQKFIQGLRIDHIDGLFNPAEYLQKLRKATGEEMYIITEKILHENEEIICSWPVQGTSGYDFLSFTNQLMTDAQGRETLTRFYRSEISVTGFKEMSFECKYAFLKTEMNGELDNLVRWMKPWLDLNKKKVREKSLRESLALLMAAFPVYRVYADGLPLTDRDRNYISRAFDMVMQKYPRYHESFHILHEIFNTDPADPASQQALLFIRRWSQYTAPLAAKGIEDTAFYKFNALIGNNEVGDSPAHSPVTATVFHRLMQTRKGTAALSLNASSTHDTKRGEDNRIRINLISLHAEEWMEMIRKLKNLNQYFLKTENNIRIPSVNDEYMIYQALLGAMPADMNITASFEERFKSYLTKATREAKLESDWGEPNSVYENHCFEFAKNILHSDEFKKLFFPFLHKIMEEAMIFSLSQTILKLTAPGIPDIYQGAELWDLSMVDPDNRMQVDFSLRIKLMDEIISREMQGEAAVLDFVKEYRLTGAEKLLLIRKILFFRREHPNLFSAGDYVPVLSAGNAISFIRRWENQEIMVLAPLPGRNDQKIFDDMSGIKGIWKNLITGKSVELGDRLDLDFLLEEFPVGILQKQNN